MRYVIIFIFILILCVGIVKAEPMNDTNTTYDNNSWYDNHWGGDTGDNEYVELPPPIVVDKDPGYKVCCLSTYITIICIPYVAVQKYRNKRLEDE